MENIKLVNLLSVIIVCGFLGGCNTSEVISVGEDTYMVTSSGAGFSTASVRENVFQKASEYCESKGLVMMPVSFNAEPGRMGRNAPSADLVFRALKPGDPELGRPNLRESDEKLDISHDINIKTDQPAGKEADLYGELLKLNELKEKGILTEEEFQKQKEKLLSN